jgi:hypothetical protein
MLSEVAISDKGNNQHDLTIEGLQLKEQSSGDDVTCLKALEIDGECTDEDSHL